jgi:hypothetical protein
MMAPAEALAYSRHVRIAAVLAGLVAVVFGLGACALTASGEGRSSRPLILGPGGIGAVRFGLAKTETVAALAALFGAPVARGVNTGCGPRYTEVVWADLAVEFRSNRFSGYRYIEGGYPISTPGSPREPRPTKITPRLATATGITLGSTLAQVRVAYPPLQRIGADWWQAKDGLVFIDNAKRDPVPPTSHIEIKTGTCGGF